jgi:NAD(P)-dependent dehydrogenase (short-subunit alcohol dehydrogenase family)
VDLGLKDRVAIVTGAGAGIGLATAKRLVSEGVRVVGAGLETEALRDIGPPDGVLAVDVDMAQPEAGETVAAAARKAFGQIDILFNNAGRAPARESFLVTSDDEWRATLELNLMGYVRMARAVLPTMLSQGRGVLIHCGSEAGRLPVSILPDYCVSKAGVLMLSKYLAREYTSKGVRSNVVAPAHIRTPLWDVPGGFLDALAQKFDCPREEAVAAFLRESRLPAGRLGRPEEVASMVAFLASDLAEFISGESVGVDGGVIPTI